MSLATFLASIHRIPNPSVHFTENPFCSDIYLLCFRLFMGLQSLDSLNMHLIEREEKLSKTSIDGGEPFHFKPAFVRDQCAGIVLTLGTFGHGTTTSSSPIVLAMWPNGKYTHD